jgi:hypothetical protein
LKMINSFHLNVVKLNGLPTNVSVPIAQKWSFRLENI